MSLRRLLHPYAVEDFFASFWEKRYLHVTREENPALQSFFEGLVTLDDIDELLTTTFASAPRPWDSIRMGQSGIMISPETYLSNQNGVMADVNVERVLELHRCGASIILNSVHEVREPVAELCRSLSRSMGVRVHGNIYLTPPAAQGFPIHFDSHDVFLLQLVGEKQWKLAQSSAPLATVQAQTEEQLVPQGPQTTVNLKSGELLYIPRGVLHKGETSTQISAHLTIGMNPFTWGQLLHDLVSQMEAADVEYRRSVPTGPALLGQVGEKYQVTLSCLVKKLYEDDGLISRSVERIVRERSDLDRPNLRGFLTCMHDIDWIDLDTPIQLRAPFSPTIELREDEIALHFENRVLTLPAFTEPHVRALLASGPIRGRDLPPGIDHEGKLVLIRRLVQEGLLLPQKESSACGDPTSGSKNMAPRPFG